MAPLAACLALLAAAAVAHAQSATPTPAPNVTNIVTSVQVTRTTVSRGNTIPVTAFVPTTIASTLPNTTTATSTSTTATASPTQPTGPVLDTKIDPAFGVLGALLVLTGLPSAFLGHKNRWSSFFLTGFYSLSLACLALILKYGVIVAVHPPNRTLRGLFVLACGVAGVAGGGISIFFWQQTKYFIGAWGGFALGLWIQCFHTGGVIRPIGLRWILYIGCGVVGFILCTIPKLHYHTLIAGTAITGASAFMLGVDCFTTAGLKEFYVYNLGFTALFPKFADTGFPLSQVMEIELGLVAAVTLMGAAVQLRVLVILKRKLAEINQEERKREIAAEAKAVARLEHVQRDLAEWEKEHGKSAARPESGISGMPLMKDMDEPSTPGGGSTVIGGRPRTRSGLSDFGLGNEERPTSRFNQNPGLLPAMNLGLGLDSELPGGLISEDTDPLRAHPDLLKKEELLAEIQTIRKSIDALRSDSSASGDSRRPSMSMHSRTLSGDAAALRPPPPRDRVHSMDVLSTLHANDSTSVARATEIGRSSSTPLRDDDWDAYLRERKLFQPPAGPSAPIATTPLAAPVARPAAEQLPVPDAVADALAARQRREAAFAQGGRAEDTRHRRSNSGGPVNILPPRTARAGAGAEARAEDVPRTRTFEELVARHQEKLRALQAPLSAREQEQADVAAAKARWERSRATEKEAAARRRAEKEAALARRSRESPRRPAAAAEEGARRPGMEERRRSSSVDRLAAEGGGSKRASTAKVQEWQRYQQEADKGALPFPDKAGGAAGASAGTGTGSGERRRSRAGVPRDPPS